MVRRLAGDGDRVALVIGQRRDRQDVRARRRARGVGGQRRPGRRGGGRAGGPRAELEEGAGIPSTSVAALLAALPEPAAASPCRAGVDEAGMVPTRELYGCTEPSAGRAGKLVLVGDDRQLPEIDAGGVVRGLRTRLDVIELRENRRQVAAWEREALELLRDGRGEEALERYSERGRITVGEGAESGEQLVADWAAAEDPSGSVMLAYRRDDVADLNRRARQVLIERGEIRGPELRVGRRAFAVGDHVVLRRNDRRLGVANGDRGGRHRRRSRPNGRSRSVPPRARSG